MARTRLTDSEITAKLGEIPGFALANGKLTRRFEFADFVTAFGWMASVALVAEKLDHHPDWKNVYKTVDVELNTHDAGGVTEMDFKLARRMNALFEASS
ncbi:MAG TPA: 4a-hydroxytetrahydrobiopterin dehydratase [Polyangiaceae bacterium]|jgi:4a-hydroxytetrahydrobiopterin dehydratase|nr:4a-hydroxytetrahydrobiopterin dehydratase [Polyangiaceae bacterium]